MGQHVLIAEAHDILRLGLHMIFTEDTRVSKVHEVATQEALKTHLHSFPLDLVVIDQLLVTDITILPRGNFVILASEPDMSVLQAAYKHGARGYLSVSAPVELLRTMIHPAEGSFLLDPIWTPWLMKYLDSLFLSSTRDQLLTAREREIVSLLESGLNRHSIAQELHITDGTLKIHLKHIARKRRSEPHSQEDDA